MVDEQTFEAAATLVALTPALSLLCMVYVFEEYRKSVKLNFINVKQHNIVLYY